MITSNRKTLSSVFVITLVIFVFSLIGSTWAQNQAGPDANGDTPGAPEVAKKDSGNGAQFVEYHFSEDNQFKLMVVIVALAAYVRLRIEWSKKHIRSRKYLFPILLVEWLIQLAGFMLVVQVFQLLPTWVPGEWLDLGIWGTFVLGVLGLFLLAFWQAWLELKWIGEKPRNLPGFLSVEEGTDNCATSMKIRIANIVTMRERPGQDVTTVQICVFKDQQDITVKGTLNEIVDRVGRASD